MTENHYDVFLSYNSKDAQLAEDLARRLTSDGIKVWLGKWHLVPGKAWQARAEAALDLAASCAVVIGPNGISSWQDEEMRSALEKRVASRTSETPFPVIPVLLPGANRGNRGNLPRFLFNATWVEFHTADDSEALQSLICGIRGISPFSEVYQGKPSNLCPYQGLKSFDIDDAPFFFGRQALTDWLLDSIRPRSFGVSENRFVAIVGPSGSGKSSVARAGILARLKNRVFPKSHTWPVVTLRPGPEPIENLSLGFLTAATESNDKSLTAFNELCSALRDSEKALHLSAKLSLSDKNEDARLVVFIDQFEELFTESSSSDDRTSFVENIAYASTIAGGKVVVLLTLRADFYGECAVYPSLANLLSSNNFLIEPMSETDLRSAIEDPAALAGSSFEAGLVEVLVKEVKEEKAVLPLMQYALLELWNRRIDGKMRHDAYIEIGGVEGAIRSQAEKAYRGLKERDRETCRRILLRLVHTADGVRTSKRRAPENELVTPEGSESIGAVLRTLASPDLRLITIEPKDRIGSPRFIELTHEALIRSWERLKGWIDEDREFLLWRHRLAGYHKGWKRAQEDPDALLRGAILDEALRWMEKKPEDLNHEESKFIDDSLRSKANSDRQQEEKALLETFQHQLRAPIVQIYQNCQYLLEDAQEPLTERIREFLLTIRALSGTSVRTISALKLFSGDRSEIFNLRPIPTRFSQIAELLMKLANELQPISQRNKRIRLQLDRNAFSQFSNLRVKADLILLEQAFINVLDNALKYSYPKSKVHILARRNREHLYVVVQNKGLKVTSGETELFLARGWRGKKAKALTPDGTGLGLWVVEKIMKAHQGDVRVHPTSQEDITEIQLCLPLTD